MSGFTFDKEVTSFRKNLGLTTEQAEKLRHKMSQLAAETGNIAITSEDTQKAIESLNAQLETLKARKEQKDFKFDEEQEQVREATRDSDELDANDKEVDSIIKDTINCVNGR